jgi:hypothetical protein
MQFTRWKEVLTFAILSALTVFVVPEATAQMRTMDAESPFKVGVRGELTQATVYGDDVAQADFRSGFTGGAFFTYQVNSAFSIQPEVLYSVRGGDNVDLETTPATESLRARNDFLQIPVLFKLSAPFNELTPRLYIGPSVGFLLDAELGGQDADESFNNVDFNGVVGGELAWDLNQESRGIIDEVAVDGRYNLGFVDLGDASTLESLRTSAFSGTLSLRFNI